MSISPRKEKVHKSKPLTPIIKASDMLRGKFYQLYLHEDTLQVIVEYERIQLERMVRPGEGVLGGEVIEPRFMQMVSGLQGRGPLDGSGAAYGSCRQLDSSLAPPERRAAVPARAEATVVISEPGWQTST